MATEVKWQRCVVIVNMWTYWLWEEKKHWLERAHSLTSRKQAPNPFVLCNQNAIDFSPSHYTPATYVRISIRRWQKYIAKYFSYLRKHLDHFMLIFFLIYEYYLYDNLFIFSAWICGRNRPTKYTWSAPFYLLCGVSIRLLIVHSFCLCKCVCCVCVCVRNAFMGTLCRHRDAIDIDYTLSPYACMCVLIPFSGNVCIQRTHFTVPHTQPTSSYLSMPTRCCIVVKFSIFFFAILTDVKKITTDRR